jgi:Uncharacterized conserved protein (COG2071)
VRIRLDVQHLLMATWEADRKAVERVTPPGAEPATIGGRYAVSVVSFRVRRGRAGALPVAPFSQLNLRTYVTWKDEPAVLFLAARVTAGGLPALLFGAPYRGARLRVRSGEVRAAGLGVLLRYRPAGPGEPGELGRHELGIFTASGLKGIRVERGPAEWQAADLLEPAKAHILLGYGFAPKDEPDLLYAAETSFETEPGKDLA